MICSTRVHSGLAPAALVRGAGTFALACSFVHKYSQLGGRMVYVQLANLRNLLCVCNLHLYPFLLSNIHISFRVITDLIPLCFRS